MYSNMGNARAANLEAFVPPGGLELDLLALGFQESTYDMDSTGRMLDSRDHLQQSIQAILGPEFYLVSICIYIYLFMF